MPEEKPYRPISCSVHDLIEHHATLRSVVEIQFLNADGELLTLSSRILDWKSTPDGEFIVLSELPELLRMDRLVKVDGTPVHCC